MYSEVDTKMAYVAPSKDRVIEMTDEERDFEMQMFFELPRKNCEQMVPALLRLKLQQSKKEQHRKLFLYKKMMKRNRVQKINQFMQHIIEFDKSEAIIPHGQVSKKVYEELAGRRSFDLYGRPIKSEEQDEATVYRIKRVAEKLGLDFKKKNAKGEEMKLEDEVVNIFGDTTLDLKAPALQTAKWKVGVADTIEPPPGFSRNPANQSRSEGNETLYAYDGDWEHGQMSGWGTYLYEDKTTYKGQYKKNRAWGEGRSDYANGNWYEGDWIAGKYDGKGFLHCYGGSEYKGDFVLGRRHGYGVLNLPSGLIYEGEWCDGKPHGKGVMTSTNSKYSYEGQFVKGSISGTGALITPNKERVIRWWAPPAHHEERLLPQAIKIYLEEKEAQEQEDERIELSVYGIMRGFQLRGKGIRCILKFRSSF